MVQAVGVGVLVVNLGVNRLRMVWCGMYGDREAYLVVRITNPFRDDD